jgi:hypothetical protein
VLSIRVRKAAPQRLQSVLLIVGLAIALLVAPAAAQAAPAAAQSQCPFTSTLCLFSGTNFTGDRFTVSSLVPEGTCVSLVDHGWGDRAHSGINTHSNSVALFMNDDCIGGPFQIAPNTGNPNFGSFTPESVWVPRD